MSTSDQTESAAERRRRLNREYVRAKRAAMTPQERADARREHDRTYRDAHRQQRQEYDRNRAKQVAQGRWQR